MNSNGMDRSPKAMAQAKANWQKELVDMQVWQCCLNCLNWDGKQCDKFKAIPPPHIIVIGCQDHCDDIPF